MAHKYPRTIAAAAKILDEVYPSWWKKINIDKIDMNGCYSCILGQLYGEYSQGMNKVFGRNSLISTRTDDRILGMRADRNAWIKEIKLRYNVVDSVVDINGLTKAEVRVIIEAIRKAHPSGQDKLKLKLYELIYE